MLATVAIHTPMYIMHKSYICTVLQFQQSIKQWWRQHLIVSYSHVYADTSMCCSASANEIFVNYVRVCCTCVSCMCEIWKRWFTVLPHAVKFICNFLLSTYPSTYKNLLLVKLSLFYQCHAQYVTEGFLLKVNVWCLHSIFQYSKLID